MLLYFPTTKDVYIEVIVRFVGNIKTMLAYSEEE